MSQFKIDIEYDDRQIQAAFQRLIRAGTNMAVVFNDIGEYLLKEHEDRWREGVGPDGFAWAELTEDTWKKKRKNNESFPLFGNPAQMLTRPAFNATSDSVELVIPSDIAQYHQYGTRNMPARELLGINAADEREIHNLLKDYLIDSVKP